MAVYTEVSDEDLRGFLARYDLGEVLSFKGIAEGVENSNYFLQTTRDRFILTLYEKRVRETDLPFFLGLMEHLAEGGLECPLPVRDREGQAPRTPCRPAFRHCHLPGGDRGQAARRRALPRGRRRARPLPRDRKELFRTATQRLVARFLAGLYAGAGGAGGPPRSGARGPHGGRTRRARRDLADGLPDGVIHADLFTDNVFFIGDRLSGLIDFYFACTDALAYDLAICLNAWCFEPDWSFNATKGRAMIAGYQSVRPLEPEEVDALPALARGSALRFMLTRLVDWLNVPPGALVRPKDPLEYDRKLAFHRRVASAAEYGWEPVRGDATWAAST
jgi:homoserine kinase type II